MKSIKEYEFWFVTGSQHLYGPETLEQVAKDSQAMVDGLKLRQAKCLVRLCTSRQ